MDDEFKIKWKKFLVQHPRGNAFQSLEMYEVWEKTKNCKPILVFLEDRNEIIGCLLAIIQKEYSGTLGYFTARSIIWGGPLLKGNDPILLKKILSEYDRELGGRSIYTQFRNMWQCSEEEKTIFFEQGYKWEEHLDIIHDLSINVDTQFQNVHSGRRKNIRRAEKCGLKFCKIENNDDFNKAHSLVEETYKRVHLPLPDKSFFKESSKILSEAGILKTFAAMFKNEIIASRMVLCYNGLIYDWYAGASQNHLDKYPNDFLPWKIIEWGSINGYHSFDFGGAGKPNEKYGVRDHKQKFGGEVVNHGRFLFVHKPLLYKIGGLGLKVYKQINK